MFSLAGSVPASVVGFVQLVAVQRVVSGGDRDQAAVERLGGRTMRSLRPPVSRLISSVEFMRSEVVTRKLENPYICPYTRTDTVGRHG